MTERRACPPAPGPLEEYAARFDDLLVSLAQRRGLREYLTALPAPRDRTKTLTCLAGAEPVTGSKDAAVQRLQFFLTESTWDDEKVNDRRLHLMCADPATAPHDQGVLVIDDSGDRKDGTATAHVGRQWPGRPGKTDNGIVTVTTVWTDGRIYYPLDAQPCTPAHHFARGRADSNFRTKRRSPPLSQLGANRRASPAGPWWPTAPTRSVTTGTRFCARQVFPTWWHFGRTAAAGLAPTSRTPRSTPPAPWPGPVPTIQATGGRSSAAFATGTPRPGGPPMPAWAATDPTVRVAWS